MGAEGKSNLGRKKGGRNSRVRRGYATNCVVLSKHLCSLILDLLACKMGLYIFPHDPPHTHPRNVCEDSRSFYGHSAWHKECLAMELLPFSVGI